MAENNIITAPERKQYVFSKEKVFFIRTPEFGKSKMKFLFNYYRIMRDILPEILKLNNGRIISIDLKEKLY